jgi:hypothetical protein
MNTQDIEVRGMKKGDLDDAVSLLTAAFQNSRFYRYIENDDSLRLKFLAVNFRDRLTNGLGVNDIDLAVNKGKILGIAVWAPPVERAQAHSMDELFAPFPPDLKNRFTNFLEILLSSRDSVMQHPYWSLAPVAVLPLEKQKGIASILIRKKLAEIDAAHLPCFLGTQDKINTAIYARYGFKTAREDIIAPAGPGGEAIIHYTMVRSA